jgi:superfamily II DNA or RNA helicase
MIRLYDYQVELIKSVRSEMMAGRRRILVQSPTGSGKTVVFSYIVKEMERKGKRALIITDRIELLFETGGTLAEFDLNPFSIVAGQMKEPPKHQVYIAMSQTLRRRIERWPDFFRSFDVVIMDECHKQEFNPYFETNCFNGAYILGFSATPTRSGKQRQLGKDFEVLVEGLQVPELIKRGKLVRDKYFGIAGADMKGVRLNSFGDYQESSMFDRFNKRELYKGVVENWQRIASGTATLVFCVNIQHTIETCKAFNESGITAKFLVSDVSLPIHGEGAAGKVRQEIKMAEYENYRESFAKYSGDRELVVADWKANKFSVLVNAGILTTGFNRRDIQTIIVNRATTSVALWLQMIGRGSRTYTSKTHFNILDFGGNVAKLGYYNQQREWTLWHDEAKSGGAPPVKECGNDGKPDKRMNLGCGCRVFASARICPFCGFIFEQEKKAKFAELIEMDYTRTFTPERNTYAELERECESKGYKSGWVIYQIIASDGYRGLVEFAKFKGYQRGWVEMTARRYRNEINKFNAKNVISV